MDFLDTNILVYAVSPRSADEAKRERARGLLRLGEQAISLQVLHEFYAVCRSPRKLNLSHDEAVAYLQPWRRFFVLEPTLETLDAALALCARYPLSFYDANILAAAAQAGCERVWSEDLNPGQTYGTVRVMNPFAA